MTATRIVVPLVDGGATAFDAAAGKPAWRVDLLAARPIVADAERVYIVSGDALHALQVATGTPVWRAETGRLTSTPVVRSGWVIVASGGNITAIRAEDGTQVWQRAVGAVENRPAIDGDLLVVPIVETRVLGLDLHSGDVRWERPLAGAPGDVLAVGGMVYFGASDKRFYALRASNGEVHWSPRVGAGPRGAAAADDDHVYFVSMDNILRAFDRGNGAVRWNKQLRFRPADGPVLLGGTVLVPGAISAPPVYGRDGTKLIDLRFPATLSAFSNVVADKPLFPSFAMVTGDLNQPWTLWMIETSTDPPKIPIEPLKEPPGEMLPVAPPR